MDSNRDYFVYRDEAGSYGYASRCFYNRAEHFLEGLDIVSENLTENDASRLAGSYNQVDFYA